MVDRLMYLDACILLKLLVREPDSDFFVRSLEGELLVTSEVAPTELFSALLSRERAGGIGAGDRRRALREFEGRLNLGEIRLGPLTGAVLRKAGQVMERCHPEVPIRTLDAIHLATADLCQDFPLATVDARMRGAAGLLGFPLFPAPAGSTAD